MCASFAELHPTIARRNCDLFKIDEQFVHYKTNLYKVAPTCSLKNHRPMITEQGNVYNYTP